MTPQLILGYCTLILAIIGGIWGIIRLLLLRNRKNLEDQQRTMWEKLDAMRKELSAAQQELGILRERVRALPDQKEFSAQLQAQEEKLDRKLQALAQQIQESFVQATQRFRCPHDPG